MTRILFIIALLIAITWTVVLFAQRSSQWATVRAAHLEREPVCVACGGDNDIQVHHVIPIGVNPSLELDPGNLITLCRRDHLTFGHFGNFERHNPRVRQHAETYRRWILEWEGEQK